MSEQRAVTTKSVVLDEEQNKVTKESQAKYEGNHHMDKVEVTINQETPYYKKGQKDTVHPTTALIFESKGIIDKGWDKKVKAYNAPKVVDGQLATN